MTVTVLPDVEKMIADWALATDALNDLVDGRIYTAVPAAPVWPLVRLQRLGGAPPQRLYWLDRASIQFDVWGGPKSTARLIAETFRAHLASALVGAHDLGVVTAVETGALLWLPDPSFTAAKPRYVFDVAVTFHP